MICAKIYRKTWALVILLKRKIKSRVMEHKDSNSTIIIQIRVNWITGLHEHWPVRSSIWKYVNHLHSKDVRTNSACGHVKIISTLCIQNKDKTISNSTKREFSLWMFIFTLVFIFISWPQGNLIVQRPPEFPSIDWPGQDSHSYTNT